MANKLIDSEKLAKLARALDLRAKTAVDDVEEKVLDIEANLQQLINEVKDMLGGKSLIYLTQAEYDALSDAEKNDETKAYFITDAEDANHYHDNKEFLDSLTQDAFDNLREAVQGIESEFTALEKIIADIEDNKANVSELEQYQKHTDENLTTTSNTIVGAINETANELNEFISETNANFTGISQLMESFSNNKADLAALLEYQKHTDTNLTTDSNTIVGAINELNLNITNLETTFDADIEGALTEINNNLKLYQKIEDQSLETSHKTVPGAINEVRSSVTDLTTGIQSILSELEQTINGLEDNKADASDLEQYQKHTDENLKTIDNTIVGAINEVVDNLSKFIVDMQSIIGTIDQQLANKLESTDLAIYQTIREDSLQTDAKTIPGAINDLVTAMNTIRDNILTPLQTRMTAAETNIDNLGSSKQDKTSGDLTTTSKNLVEAINEINGKVNSSTVNVGTMNELLTEHKTTIVGAINELHSDADTLRTDIALLDRDKLDKAELEGINNDLFNVVAKVIALETYKADKEDLATLDALTLNGYSLWVGTSEELAAIGEKNPNTLYFEIGDDESSSDEVVLNNVNNGVLTLTKDKYQKVTNMVTGTEIVLPEVNNFTEIHLFFLADSDMNLVLPEGCKWRLDSNIETGNAYELIFKYNTLCWLVDILVYS